MSLPDAIRDRIELFARNEEQYRDPSYKEAQLRQEFLDPLFAALGWDMDNRAGHAEPYKDVVHEDAIKIGSETKAPDYSFRIGGTRKFFVEAKKPSVLIKDDPEPAYQLRRYSWSAKLPLGILSDFQEFAIYDTRVRPAFGDKASTARLFYCTYRDFPEKWDEIAGIFAKDSVLRGSFDQYAAATRGKRGTATVDDAFLEEIERWRDLLARHLAPRNTGLSQRDLNFAVQRLIDRLVFLRIAEDRGLEPFGQLQALTAGNRLYPRLCELFERADYRYNSGLFHFEKDSDCTESPDRLSLRLDLDDAPLKDVLKNLYYPASPYVFSVIPADILGSVYERFLGKVIHLTDGHHARIEEKPEVRKAGGVYYTPTYIVDYIVRQTVGTLVADKTPKQIEKLRVLDPACGSGSFLIGAYQFLLDWYLDYYAKNDPEKWAKQKPPRVYQTNPNAAHIPPASRLSPRAPNWQLTTAERKRILLAHIHGVDLDSQAVEVTKLSLLLKVLEGEARETQGRTREMSAVLPDLGKNIRCGNSLVGHDFYAQPDLPTLDDEARLQLNTFDWAEGFPEIMRAGGFDAVIGNPPYIQLSMEEFRNPAVNEYLKESFGLSGGRLNTFILFIERSRNLVRVGGVFGLIVPNTLTTQEYYEEARARLLSNTHLQQLIRPAERVFADAVVENVILLATRRPPETLPASSQTIFADLSKIGVSNIVEIPQTAFSQNFRMAFVAPADPGIAALRRKLESGEATFGDLLNINQAIALKGDRAACLENRKLTSKHHEVLDGRHIRRYFTGESPNYFKFDVSKIHSCKREDIFVVPEKILFRRVGASLIGTIDRASKFALNTLVVMTPKRDDQPVSLPFVLGLFNSKLLNFYYANFLKSTKKVFSEIQARQVGELPMPSLKEDDKRYASVIKLVDTMLALHTKLAAAQSPDVEENLRRQIAATDKAIDTLVYALYGLTPEEIALVESATTPDMAPAAPAEIPAVPVPPGAYVQAQAAAAHAYFVNEDPASPQG